MIYDCLFYNDDFVIAKPVGWPWSQKERELPFNIHQSPEMREATEDYQVEVNGQELWASQIDWSLIHG